MKNRKLGIAILIIGYLAFSVIAFVISTEHSTSFWAAYSFTAIAFLVQLIIWRISFRSLSKKEYVFLGIPATMIGVAYLITQIVVFILAIAVPFA